MQHAGNDHRPVQSLEDGVPVHSERRVGRDHEALPTGWPQPVRWPRGHDAPKAAAGRVAAARRRFGHSFAMADPEAGHRSVTVLRPRVSRGWRDPAEWSVRSPTRLAHAEPRIAAPPGLNSIVGRIRGLSEPFRWVGSSHSWCVCRLDLEGLRCCHDRSMRRGWRVAPRGHGRRARWGPARTGLPARAERRVRSSRVGRSGGRGVRRTEVCWVTFGWTARGSFSYSSSQRGSTRVTGAGVLVLRLCLRVTNTAYRADLLEWVGAPRWPMSR